MEISYCRKVGHLKPYCYKLHGYPKSVSQSRRSQSAKEEKEWIPKKGVTKEVSHISLKASAEEAWYFDSGCSRHMTSIKNFLV